MSTPKSKFIFWGLFLAAGFFALALSRPVQAVSGSDWRSGRIIDDKIFYNKGTMSAAQIQSFLNAKVPTCDTNGDQVFVGYYGGRYYSASDGVKRRNLDSNYPAPYTCLKDYYENTTTKENNYGKTTIPAGAISAAQIIYNVAQARNINPQVLIVLLQKEQTLVTDDWPWYPQYRTATGYGCPDGAPCDSQYYGFYNQVDNAARQFNVYKNNPTAYNYIAGRNNNILYNPNAACGYQSVYIENQATAGLYIYTPYVPNPAALNNLYGLGDSCSAYGNRNFWRLFNDWFGTTLWPGGTINIDWKFETLDGTPGSISGSSQAVGQFPALVDFGGILHLFYYDSGGGTLKHAYTGGGWHFETLDGGGGAAGRINSRVGETPAVINFNNSLHVFYHDISNGTLRHAYSDSSGANWTFETLDGAGGSDGRIEARMGLWPCVAVYKSTLQLFYYDNQFGRLRHAWNDGVKWKFENLDGDAGAISRFSANVGDSCAVATYTDGSGITSLQLYYYDSSNGSLRHAWAGYGGWRFETLDGTSSSISRFASRLGRNPTIANYRGSLQLYYYDIARGNLRHAWTSPDQPWRFENLDGDPGSIGREDADLGQSPNAVVFNDILYVFYYNASSQLIKHAYSGSGWNFGNIDGSNYSASYLPGNVGLYPAAVPFGSDLQLYYYDSTNASLRHAWGPLATP